MAPRETDSTPHYLRLKRYIANGIAAGTWAPRDRIPSEGELMRLFGVARMTANRALRELAAEGLIARIQGVGSFVAAPKTESTAVAVRGIRAEIEARGQRHSTLVLALESVSANAALAAQFELAPGNTLYRSCLLHRADEVPLQFEERYVNPAAAPDYLTLDFTTITPHEHLMRVAPLDAAEHVIEAEKPNAELRRILALAADEPTLVLNRRTWSRGRIASLARLVHPASRFRLVGHLDHPR